MCLCSWKCAIVSQEEQRASDMVLFTNENNDIATIRVSIHRFSLVKKGYDQSAGFSSAKRVFLSRCFLVRKSRYVYNKYIYQSCLACQHLIQIRVMILNCVKNQPIKTADICPCDAAGFKHDIVQTLYTGGQSVYDIGKFSQARSSFQVKLKL